MLEYKVKPIPQGYKFTWSISSMNTYMNCPRRWSEEYIHKNKQPFSQVAQWGVDVHDALEKSVENGFTDLGSRYESFQYVVDKVKAIADGGWKPHVEAEHCMNRDIVITGWFDSDAWVRCKIDLTLIKGNAASVIDYKTGKVPAPQYQSYEQLRLSNLMIMHKHSEVDLVKSKYWYIAKGGVMSKPVVTKREDMNETWDEFFFTTNQMEHAVANNEFPAKRNGLCKKYCHVVNCEFNGRNQ